MSDDGLLSSLRYLFADFLDEEDDDAAACLTACRTPRRPSSSEGIQLLMDYQGAGYASSMSIGSSASSAGKASTMPRLREIARLMAKRMAYEDAIRIAQSSSPSSTRAAAGSFRRTVKLRFDELVDALPAIAAEPVLKVLEYLGWLHKRVSIPFSTASRWGIRRLKFEAGCGAGGCSRSAMPRSAPGSSAGCT